MFELRMGYFSIIFCFVLAPSMSLADPRTGVASLTSLANTTIQAVMPPNIRTLLTPSEQQDFFLELENSPPNWETLHNQPGEEHGERLFDFNRSRDAAREGHSLLKQPIAFLWSGILRKYHSGHHGFTVAMGPELTPTAWGIIRFKPVGLPDEMIAVPSSDLLPKLKANIANQEQVEIAILFIGKLIPNESLMYAFSHDGNEDGMIMPFVQINTVQYFLR